MYRLACLGDFLGSKRRPKPSKMFRSERVVAYPFHNGIRHTVIPQLGRIPRITAVEGSLAKRRRRGRLDRRAMTGEIGR